MNFLDRLKLALAVTFNTKTAALLLPTWQNGEPSYPEASFENMVKFGWRKNELIFTCVSKTAATASFVRLQVMRERDGKPLDDHPLRQLIRRPNPFMDEFDFWYSVVCYQKLAGGAYFEKERDRAGRVIRLWPLRPDWVFPLRSQRDFIGGYQYMVPGGQPITIDARDVLDFKLFDPMNLYRGYPPAAVAGRVGDVDNATTDYLKMFMQQGGMPPGLLKTKQKLLDQDVADIRRRWGERYGGIAHWMEPAVLDSDAEFQQVGMSFKDMGFDILDARSEARICMVMNVPPIIVGAKIGLDRATYSNYGEARLAWWEDTLIPQYRNFESVIAGDLGPEFGDGLTVSFDLGDVPALKEGEDSKWGRANEGLSRGYLTINEARQVVGLEAIGEPGDRFLRPSGATEIGLDGEPVREPLNLAPAEDEEPVDEEDAVDAVDEGDAVDEDESGEAARIMAMEAKGRRAPDDEERRQFEKRLRQGLEEYFAGQLERIGEAVGEQYQPVALSKNGHGTAD